MGNVFFGGGKVGMKAPSVSRLPEGYTELTYIESGGTQYIDTGFKPTANTKIECDFEYTDISKGQYSGIYITGSWFMFGINGKHEVYLGNKYAIGVTAAKERTVITMDAAGKTATIGSNSYSFSGGSFTTPSINLPIFAYKNASSVVGYCYFKLYSYKIYESGELIRDFVPCLSDADGVGLYDLVEGKFYGNAGTGGFIGGEEVA